MQDDLVRLTPNKEKARSILRMVETTLEMIKQIDKRKFPSNIAKEYYEVIREMISILLLLDGFKAYGEGAHKKQIDYLELRYKSFSKSEIILIDDLRIVRNKIAYDGFFVKESYINRKLPDLLNLIGKLRDIIDKKLA
jgi:hypothetical protein